MLIIKDIQELNQNVICNLIDLHKDRLLPRYKKLQHYYEAKHDILDKKVSDSSKPNNKLVNDYPGYITNMATGYFIGKPVSYSSKSGDDGYLEALQEIFDYNDEADENSEIAKTCSIKGEAFELMYQDEEGKTRFIQVPNEQIIVIYDTKLDPKISVAIRYYHVSSINSTGLTNNDLKTITKIEVYTKDKIQYYTRDGVNLTLDAELPHYFGEVPVIHYLNNKEQLGDFEKVASLVNAYNQAESDTMDDMDYFNEAYLMLKNMSGTNSDDVQDMKKNRVILVEGDGDAGFLTKDINDAAVENFKKRLNTDIHKFACVPDLSDEQFSGNVSGIAIKFKYSTLESLTSMKERKFKRALQRRIELITNILNIKGGNYDYTDIDMSFTRNLPANITEISDMVSKLNGIASQETLLNQLPFVTDVQSEMDKIAKEKEDTLSNDYNDLSNPVTATNNNNMVAAMNNTINGVNNG